MTKLTDLSTGGRTRAEQLAALLEERIRTLAPGEPVGTIEDIRRESGLARATVSEAIRLLRDRGVLAIKPGRGGGLFAAEAGPVVRMRRTLLAVREEPSAVADAIELRNHLEELIDVGAARCRTAADVPRLRSRLDAMAAAGSWGEFVRANWALHEEIAALCPNAMARAVYLGTLGHLSTTEPNLSGPGAGSYRARRLRVHADLVDAIVAGDEAAVRAAVARHHITD
ncbi:FadR/GntR family transcriptional regulator [Amycolatopsis granulosa]|uniref:FadR/GntR family transcriptional regulator n=1 Tax=Amycolatopsis granulosa TaxID=185684 RepID=UPI001420A18A|nr:FCD domain-containing protein [Amycolatopsis granulosa]NIH88344.1 DNA-binding FadR family transcriptional regulator [Amycolatopsis granulosa]